MPGPPTADLRRALATAYDLPADDLLAAVRVWLCYTATSSYPFDELAGGRALLPENLRAYARDRQDAVVAVLAELDAIEDAVRDSSDVVRIPGR